MRAALNVADCKTRTGHPVMTYQLYIGDRTFSSWSLRGWLMLEKFGLPDGRPLSRDDGRGYGASGTGKNRARDENTAGSRPDR